MSQQADESLIPNRIISGGQTGVDRAGLEAAIAYGIEHGGWCPKGRRSEDGSIPSRYQLEETDSADYAERTEQNVIDGDATLILYERKLSGGTLLTRRYAVKHDRDYLCLRMETSDPIEIRRWLAEVRPRILNVAGPRESNNPGIQQRAFEFLMAALTASADPEG